jgi:hypothetical protein
MLSRFHLRIFGEASEVSSEYPADDGDGDICVDLVSKKDLLLFVSWNFFLEF